MPRRHLALVTDFGTTLEQRHECDALWRQPGLHGPDPLGFGGQCALLLLGELAEKRVGPPCGAQAATCESASRRRC